MGVIPHKLQSVAPGDKPAPAAPSSFHGDRETLELKIKHKKLHNKGANPNTYKSNQPKICQLSRALARNKYKWFLAQLSDRSIRLAKPSTRQTVSPVDHQPEYQQPVQQRWQQRQLLVLPFLSRTLFPSCLPLLPSSFRKTSSPFLCLLLCPISSKDPYKLPSLSLSLFRCSGML